jgi:hypothetical protein
MMEPMRVTATMAESIVYYGDGMHLDGPLAYGAYMSMPLAERQALPPVGHTPWPLDMDLPLARWICETPLSGQEQPELLTPEGLAWGWCCSAAHAEWLMSGRHSVRKMPQSHEMVRRTREKSANIAGGQLKACDVALPSRFARTLVWYAVGNIAQVRALLDRVRNLGKLSNHGCGRVMRWEVEPWPVDWSRERAGELTRRMPAGYRPGEPARMGAIRAPYHHRSRRILCVEPDYEALTPREVADAA